MKTDKQLAAALEKFRKDYPGTTSGDWQTFIIGWKANQSQLQVPSEDMLDIIHCIIKYDSSETLENKGRYFESIQKDFIKSYLEQQRCKRCNRIAPLKDGLCYGCKCLTD